MITMAVSQKSTAVPTVQLLRVYSCLIACDSCGQRETKMTPYTANRATESSKNGFEKKNLRRGVQRSSMRSGSPTDQRIRSRLPV